MKNIVVHTTDLYHPHNDPDDHWDLACQYSLFFKKLIDLRGIICDAKKSDSGDPSIQSIGQLNYISNNAVPTGIGSSKSIRNKKELQEELSSNIHSAAVKMLIKILEDASVPVVINICGSCRDVAVAANLRPDLFEKKCGCIYLNAGTYGGQNPLEYNVSLEPYTYYLIYKIPCKIYWLPCFEKLTPYPYLMSDNATYFEMTQNSILPYISENMQKYFLYMFNRVMDTGWLTYLNLPVNKEQLEISNTNNRQMWGVASFFHSAGKFVDKNGNIYVEGDKSAKPIYEFVPVNINCGEDGILQWNYTKKSDRFIFKKLDAENYSLAMIKAMKNLISVLP